MSSTLSSCGRTLWITGAVDELVKTVTVDNRGDAPTGRPGDGGDGTGRPSQRHGKVDAAQGTGSAQDAVQAEFDKGRASNSSPNSNPADPGTAHTGGTTRPRSEAEAWEWAEDAYDHWRNNGDEDVDLIAQNLADTPRQDGTTGFTPEEIALMKDNVMRNEHPIDDKYEEGQVDHKRPARRSIAQSETQINGPATTTMRRDRTSSFRRDQA
ncbi:MAG TPA: hypothetical protein VKZ65_04140 [Glycomyces sp.]|jgi:hypothetical protein|nr:hypothetical protein [Glycomyces sp.]